MIIAITGSIGSGKSTIAKIFKEHGYSLINADQIGHKIYHEPKIKHKILEAFGQGILTNDEIDRDKLKQIVFYDFQELKKLNRIVHPHIVKEIQRQVSEIPSDKIIIDGALVIEAGFKSYDKLILMTIDHDVQVKRLLEKGKYNKAEIINIITSQLPDEEKIHYADFVIDNSGTLEELRNKIEKIIQE